MFLEEKKHKEKRHPMFIKAINALVYTCNKRINLLFKRFYLFYHDSYNNC